MMLPGVMEHAEILALERWRQEDQEYASLDYIVILKLTFMRPTVIVGGWGIMLTENLKADFKGLG